ncbi:uncharacterized protein RCC_01106 [Ramularia collo-cygni]|uniref:Endoglucanase I n=1 Tax=Ramularia collo-cygni TaxID=112498 RepID=A0A2D3UNT2_9PEZI|nr:uncharacterized protein RCC_01106 [Ramularia collo-cygni]CZT15238.1 uncharacterized protein RCC_01106 [Ramularia collo-cygni]
MLYLFLTLVFLARSGSAVRELCGQNDVYAQKPYLWNNNVWNADESGSSCTYTPDDPESEANMFQVLWQWPGAPVVRGYPHVEFKANMLPLKLSKLDSLVVDASWEMAPSSLKVGASHDPTTEPNASALKKENVEANVCIDIFADPDKKTSTESPKQMYEIMIWFGHFGSGALPVGNTDLLDPPVVTLIQDTEFTLYTGKNFNGQIVHSWVANRTLTSFNMDFAPLLSFLSAQDMVPDDVFLGQHESDWREIRRYCNCRRRSRADSLELWYSEDIGLFSWSGSLSLHCDTWM